MIFRRLRFEVPCRASHGPLTFRLTTSPSFNDVDQSPFTYPIFSQNAAFSHVWHFLIAMMMAMIGSNKAFLMSTAAAAATAMNTWELFNSKPNVIEKKRNRASVSYDAPKRKLPVLLFDVMDTIVRDPFYQDIPAFFGFESLSSYSVFFFFLFSFITRF